MSEHAELPYTTPSGFVYATPSNWPQLRELMMSYLQSIVECWEDAECPPYPMGIPDVQRLAWNLLVQRADAIEALERQRESRERGHAEMFGQLRDYEQRIEAVLTYINSASPRFDGSPEAHAIRRILAGEVSDE